MLEAPQERHMAHQRPTEPKIPPDDIPQSEDELLESEAERQERESQAALDRSVGRLPAD